MLTKRLVLCVLLCVVQFTLGEKNEVEKKGNSTADSKDSGSNKAVCYEEVGCFSIEAPYYSLPDRPLPPPEDPKFLDASLNFFSRKSFTKTGDVISLNGKFDLGGTDFVGSRNKTIFIMAGGGGQGQWPFRLKDALLKRLDANVFYVNTSKAYEGLRVLPGVSGTRVIGVQLARFVKYLQTKYHVRPAVQVWMIGYGVGAHLAGYAGDRVPLARITGLDPMQEFFEGYPAEVRLDRSDAAYVDIIHTDSRPLIPDFGFGMINPSGHVDFYVNGGYKQPGCRYPSLTDFIVPPENDFISYIPDVVENAVGVITATVYCHHKRAFKYFIAAIENEQCSLWGHEVSMEHFLRAVSNGGSGGILLGLTTMRKPCTLETCIPIGLDSQKSKLRGIKIITTAPDPPYCTIFDQDIPLKEKGWKALGYYLMYSIIGDNN